MKLAPTVFFTLIAFSTVAQNYEECTRKDLPRTKITVILKGNTLGDITFISLDKLKDGIELELSPSIGRIIGYYALSGCEGCDIVTVVVCGSKWKTNFFNKSRVFAKEIGYNFIE